MIREPRRTKKSIKADRQWQALVVLLLHDLGAVLNPQYAHLNEYLLETTVGVLKLSVYPRDRFVAGRFQDVPRAVERLGRGVMNPHSGKWNHHHGGMETADSLDLLQHELKKVLRE